MTNEFLERRYKMIAKAAKKIQKQNKFLKIHDVDLSKVDHYQGLGFTEVNDIVSLNVGEAYSEYKEFA